MTATAQVPGDLRSEAARLAFTLIRFAQVAAHPLRGSASRGALRLGTHAYVFSPSSRRIPCDEVETFLIGLPSPAILVPTTGRGIIALFLLHELSGDRRRSAEKEFSNAAAGLDDLSTRLGLSPASRILAEFDEESHVFPFAAVREWTQHFAVAVGWNISPLKGDERADACLKLMRSDFKPFRGQSSMVPPDWRPIEDG